MDIVDILWNYSQDKAISEINSAHETARKRQITFAQRLEEENHELRIRIGVLIRMLIERGVFNAEDYDAAVKSTQARLKPARLERPPVNRNPSAVKPALSKRK